MTQGAAAALVIETPEGVEFSYALASPVTRALAWILDAAAILLLSQGAEKLCEWLGSVNPDWAAALQAILYFTISVGYGIALEWRWHGQTLGKRVMGLRVVDAQGLRLKLSQVVLRNLLRLVDMLPVAYLVGGLASVCSRNCQRLGDLAAGTIVARERSLARPGSGTDSARQVQFAAGLPASGRAAAQPRQSGGGEHRGAGGIAPRRLPSAGAHRTVPGTGRLFPVARPIPRGGARGSHRRAICTERAARDLRRLAGPTFAIARSRLLVRPPGTPSRTRRAGAPTACTRPGLFRMACPTS